MSNPSPFQLLPRLTDDEFDALREDIRENGIRVPIDVDEDGLVLDGHHRSWIAAELGLEVPRRVVAGLDVQGKRNHARAVNAIRRHLSMDARRDQVRQMREEGQTIAIISTTLGVPKSTVGDDVKELSDSGKLAQPESIVGADGKARPTSYAQAHRPVTKSTDSHKEESFWDAKTGEQVSPPAESFKLPPVPKVSISVKQQNAEQLSADIGHSIFALMKATDPAGREVIISAWKLGADACTPTAREYVTPGWFRTIARGLNALANEWETK